MEESKTKEVHDENKKHNKIELKELNDKISSLEEEVLRSKAELINYRKRKDEEVANYLKYASSDLIISLLTVKDNFERALNVKEKVITPEEKTFLDGFKLIYQSFDEILKANGISEINPIGEIFDSSKENCLFTESNKDHKDEEVLEVLTKGYIYNDRIIRCAQVKVNKIENN